MGKLGNKVINLIELAFWSSGENQRKRLISIFALRLLALLLTQATIVKLIELDGAFVGFRPTPRKVKK